MTRQDPNSFAVNTDTVSSTARTMIDVGFTADELKVADRATITVTDDAIRWRKDGVAPTATVGFYLAKDATPLVIAGNADIKRLQFIRVTTNAALLVDLEK